MQTESQTPPVGEGGPSAQSPSNENGAVPAPASAPAPAPAKKPTRQWDAWTRQEEENFFIALRQVGKNFEKITSRVQSKNKDQVRHYYYRLIKRMNKLLGPGFALDAKNSKDANAAMLRWWSLLEKHSCSASKLHLKPRRFKTFVTALGHQLLKDRKKTKRKQSSQDPAVASGSSVTAAVQSRTMVNDPDSAKVLSIETQNAQKSGSGRGAAVKRNGGPQTGRGKGEPSNTKPPRQRRRAADGPVSLAAYKRWEKAASAGVTLVAEAAEQLERAAISEQFPSEQGDLHCPSPCQHPPSVPVGVGLTKRKNGQSQANVMKGGTQSSSVEPMKFTVEGRGWDSAVLSTSLRFLNTTLETPGTTVSHQVACQGPRVHSSLQPSQMLEPLLKGSTECCTGIAGKPESMAIKLKLQLYPIDEHTRKALEKDGHNPHLELTLKARKMISSVLQHLMQKWGRSSVASGELMLFPYNVQLKDLPNCQSWTLKDTTASARDVYAAVGSPAIFRLRYGWFSTHAFQISNAENCRQSGSSFSRIEVSESCLQCESERTVKLRRLDIGRSASMSPLTNRDDQSRRVCTEFALNLSCNGNSTNSMKTDMPCGHLATRALCVYQDSARSITLPLESVQSTTHMSTVMSVRAPAMLPSQSASLSQKMKGNENIHPFSNRFIPKHVKKVEDECRDIDQEEGSSFQRRNSSFQRISPGIAVQTLENDVPEKACRAPEFPSQIPCSSWPNEESNDGFVQRLWEDEETLKSGNSILMSTMDWVDSLTNISVGDLLNEASSAEHGSPDECPPVNTSIRCQQILQSLDSFDAAVAAHVSRSQVGANMSVHQSGMSIWDGEETCDAFAFQKIPFSGQDSGVPVKGTVEQSCCQEVPTNSMGISVSIEGFVNGISTSEGDQEFLKIDLRARHESQDGSGMRQFTPNELYWADSLGSLDMGIRPSGIQGQDLMTGDISISLSGLIASSLDAFQNCSFLGNDKKISTAVNNQDQQSLSLFCIKEIGSIYPSVTSSESMGIGRTDNTEAKAEIGVEPVDSDAAGKKGISSEYSGSFSSQPVEASGPSVSNHKLLQEQNLPGSNDSFNLHNACLRADSESKILPLVGASV